MLKTLFLSLFLLMVLPVQAWELVPKQQVSEMRHLIERQEFLVKTNAGVWRFDERGVLLRGPAPSTEKLWRQGHGKAPASQSLEAFYAASTGLVFVFMPDSGQVYVMPLKN